MLYLKYKIFQNEVKDFFCVEIHPDNVKRGWWVGVF